MKIKAGDKVQCLVGKGWLELGKVYTVTAVSKMGYIHLKEPYIQGGYAPENFQVVPLKKAGVYLPLGYKVALAKTAR